MQSVTFTESFLADGRKYVTYTFTTDTGEVHQDMTLHPANFDSAAHMTEYAARWDAMLADVEMLANLEQIFDGA